MSGVRVLKDHEIAELVNKLTAISREFHDHASLRDRISRIVVTAIKPPKVVIVGSASLGNLLAEKLLDVARCEVVETLEELTATCPIYPYQGLQENEPPKIKVRTSKGERKRNRKDRWA